MAVLDPKDDPLAGSRRRETGVAVGRPGVRVMRAGQRAVLDGARLAVGIERVFNDIVPGRADDMDEQLAGKIDEPESRAHLLAVDRDRAGGITVALLPLGEDLAVAVEQCQPAGDRRRPLTRTIIRGDEPGVA